MKDRFESKKHLLEIDSDHVHIEQIGDGKKYFPVLMLHGAVENGRIFYSSSGKGLAPYLASQGYSCFVANLRGRGESDPRISSASKYGQSEAISTEIPAFCDFLEAVSGASSQHWVAHSWGGVLMAAALLRNPNLIPKVCSMTFLGVKRAVRVQNPEKWFKVDLVWRGLAPLLARVYGFLPAGRLGFGFDNETRKSLAQSIQWVRPGPWIDPEDGFSYEAAASLHSLPPTYSLTGIGDRALGHPDDVKDFLNEARLLREGKDCFQVLSLKDGNLQDYDHINLMTHPDGPQDHFPRVAEWLSRFPLSNERLTWTNGYQIT
jgi:pimeloyl-ACP methyl ester carboxylesterase